MVKASSKIRWTPLQFLSASSLALLLVGCGGGSSGGDKGSNPTPQSVQPPRLENSYYTVEEGRQIRLAGNLHGAEIERYGVEIESGGLEPQVSLTVSPSPDDPGLLVTAPLVDAPMLVNLQITFTSAGTTYKQTVSIQISNTSAREIEEKARLVMADAPSLINLEQDLALYRFSVDTAYLYEVIPHSEKQRLLDRFLPANSTAYSPLRSKLNELTTAFSAYEKGLVSDSELEQHLDAIDGLAEQHGAYGIQRLLEVSAFSDAVIPALTAGTLKFSESVGFFSRFVENPDYGHWQDGKFELNGSYRPIASLIRLNLSQDIRCDAI